MFECMDLLRRLIVVTVGDSRSSEAAVLAIVHLLECVHLRLFLKELGDVHSSRWTSFIVD